MSNTNEIYTASDIKDATVIQGKGIVISNSFVSQSNKDLEVCLVALCDAIKQDMKLTQAQRQAATSDFNNFSEEVKKPLSEQHPETKKIFWDRLIDIIKVSPALITLSTTVAKLTGLA